MEVLLAAQASVILQAEAKRVFLHIHIKLIEPKDG